MRASSSAQEFSFDPPSGVNDLKYEPPRRPVSVAVRDISSMIPDEVDRLFRSGDVGQIPDGEAVGTALFLPGSSIQPLLARWVRNWAWQGKVFRAGPRRLQNLISPLGISAISADVYRGPSWFDAEPCVVLDYSRRSFVAQYIRDEIRRVAPGLYLGLVYWGRTRLMYFMLQFPA